MEENEVLNLFYYNYLIFVCIKLEMKIASLEVTCVIISSEFEIISLILVGSLGSLP